MQAYSLDLRKRVLADCDSDLGTKWVASKYNVSPAWVRRLKQRRRETGEIAPRRGGYGKGPRLARHGPRLKKLIRQTPDATLRELRDALGVSVSLTTLWRTLRDLGISFKKKSSTPPSRTAPTSRNNEPSGGCGRSGSTRGGSFSSTKHGRKRT